MITPILKKPSLDPLRRRKLSSNFQLILPVEAAGTLCQRSDKQLSLQEWPSSSTSVGVQEAPLNGNCGSKGSVGHLLGRCCWTSHTHGSAGFKCGFWYRWSLHSIWTTWTLLRFWWCCSRPVQILLNGSISVHLLQWCYVGNHYNPLRSSSRIGTGASLVSSLFGRCHPYRHQSRFLCTFVRRRSADLRSHAADVLRKSGDSHVHLRHRDLLMDGKQPFEAQPIKDWANMVGLVAPVETLPSRRTNYSWCSNQTNTARSEPWRDGWRWANDG